MKPDEKPLPSFGDLSFDIRKEDLPGKMVQRIEKNRRYFEQDDYDPRQVLKIPYLVSREGFADQLRRGYSVLSTLLSKK